MKYEKEFQESRNWFMAAMVIVFLFATCMLLSGCGMVKEIGIGAYNAGQAGLNDISQVAAAMADDSE